MEARVIAVTNTKGGCGKTTISMQLAGALVRHGHRVLVIDADPTAGSLGWATSADESRPFPATVVSLASAGAKLHVELKKFLADFAVIIIDCPPAAVSQTPRSALLVADLALIPIAPSPVDIRQSTEIRTIIEETSLINDTLQVRLLINQAQPRTTIARDAIAVLPEFGLELLETQIAQRVCYRNCALDGQTVFDLRPAPVHAIDEIERLTGEISALLWPAPVAVPEEVHA